MTDPAKRVDARVQWTLKGHEFNPEFMTAVKMAAKAQGQTITAFVAATLWERAQTVLKGDSDDTPRGTPPARLEDVEDRLAARLDATAEALAQRQAEAMAELARRQAEGLAAAQRQARRGRWRK